MDRYVSGSIPHPRAHGEGADFGRADLVFDGVDPIGDSYRALVFLNSPDANHLTPTEGNERFAGWFSVFGHGGCFGDDESHCAPPNELSTFQLRIPVGIPRQTRIVNITAALQRIGENSFSVTVVPIVPHEDGPQPTNLLQFTSMSLVTYGG